LNVNLLESEDMKYIQKLKSLKKIKIFLKYSEYINPKFTSLQVYNLSIGKVQFYLFKMSLEARPRLKKQRLSIGSQF